MVCPFSLLYREHQAVPLGEGRANYAANELTPQRAPNTEKAVISPSRHQRMFAGMLAKPNPLRPYPSVRGNRTALTNTNAATGHNFATFTPPRDREHQAVPLGEGRATHLANEDTPKRAQPTQNG